MGSLVPITKKTTTYQGFQIDSAADMESVLSYLRTKGAGHTGNMSMALDGAWKIWLQQANANTSYEGTIGDVVVLENDSYAFIVTPQQYSAMFNPP